MPAGAFHVGDLEAVPYPTGRFDTILVADVLPYVADPLAALRELRRICSGKGPARYQRTSFCAEQRPTKGRYVPCATDERVPW